MIFFFPLAINQSKTKSKISVPKGKYYHIQVILDNLNLTPLFLAEKIIGSYDIFISGKEFPNKDKYEIKSNSTTTKLVSSFNTRIFFISILSLMNSDINVSYEYEDISKKNI